MTKFTKPVCSGAWALGSACGACERCDATQPGMRPGDFETLLRLQERLGAGPEGQAVRDAVNALIAGGAALQEAASAFRCIALNRAGRSAGEEKMAAWALACFLDIARVHPVAKGLVPGAEE